MHEPDALGQVVLGQRGPAPVVFPSPVPLGPPSLANPVRVPDASLRDIAVFAQDEWRLRPNLSLIAGLRGDFFNVTTKATPGYDIASVVQGADPPIDPSTLPDPGGATYTRQSLTGDIGLVANQSGVLSPFIRFGRSYRHPNLEEMLFAGPATVGSHTGASTSDRACASLSESCRARGTPSRLHERQR